MKAARCDRCGKFFTDGGCNPSVLTNPDRYPRVIYVDSSLYSIDLCSECKVELKEWWNDKKAPTDVNEENRAC